MNQSCFLPLLLTAAIVAQSVISGWGHSHVHPRGHSHEHALSGWHCHPGGLHTDDWTTAQQVAQADHSRPQPGEQHFPSDPDDCSICRHLALAAILTFDQTPPVSGDVVGVACSRSSSVVSASAVGLRRPRSPPELS